MGNPLQKYWVTSLVIDKFITKSKFILPIFLFFIFLIFEFTFTFWNFIAYYLDIFFNYIYWLFWVDSKIIDAIFWWVFWVLVFLPNIFILYFFLYLLNDSWILPRISFVFDRYLKSIWLTWNSFISLFMWFGCTIPAILSTNNIKCKKERLLAVMMLPFVSCSAKIPVYVLFTSIFIPEKLQSITLIVIYIIWILLWIISNYFLSKVLKHKVCKLDINLPNYRLPVFRNIFKKIFIMLKNFLVKIAIYIIPFSVILSLAFSYPSDSNIKDTYGWKLWNYLQVVFSPLWFNEEMSISAVSWFIWKEITVSTLWSLYYIQDDDNAWLINKIQLDSSINIFSAISFIIFILLYTPCIWAIVTAKRELWFLYWFVFFIYPLIFAWLTSFFVYKILLYIF